MEEIASPIVSVVSPSFNEEGNVRRFVDEVTDVLERVGETYEIILIDDGSSDQTWASISRIATEAPRVRGVRLSRNFGHQPALLAGLSQARGRAVISMDSDLQHPPEAIELLLAEWRKGYKIVNTRRNDEFVANIFKRTTSKWFYRFFSYLADIPIEDGASDFRLLDQDALKVLLKFAHADGFIRGSVQWMGYPSIIVPYEANSRFAGQSKYTLKRMLKFAMTALTSFSTKPLRVGVWIGLGVAFLAMLELAYVVWQALEGQTVAGWASTVGVLSFLFGVLFALLGVMGIYLARIYSLLQARPFFIIHTATDGGQTSTERAPPVGD